MTVYLTAADYFQHELTLSDEQVAKLAVKVTKLEQQATEARQAYAAAVAGAAALRRRGPNPDFVVPTEHVSVIPCS